MNSDKASLVVTTVTFNCWEYTKAFLDSLVKYGDYPVTLVVVDNHSSDGTQNNLLNYFGGKYQINKDKRVYKADVQGYGLIHKVVLIFNQNNMGFGPANNQAYRLTQSDYFMGINNDTLIFPGLISKMVKAMQINPDYGGFQANSNCIGALDPKDNIPINDKLNAFDKAGFSKFEAVNKYYGDFRTFTRRFAQNNPGFKPQNCPPDFLSGWCFIVGRSVVGKQLFDPRYRIGFWEDTDLGWSIAKKGYRVGHLSEAYVHHFGHISFNSNKRKQSDRSISRANALRFAYKWSDDIRSFIQKQYDSGMDLAKIVDTYFIYRAFIGKREDYSQVERSLKEKFLTGKMTFDQFLKSNPKKRKRGIRK